MQTLTKGEIRGYKGGVRGFQGNSALIVGNTYFAVASFLTKAKTTTIITYNRCLASYNRYI